MNKDKEIEQIKRCIGELVYDKVQLRKAYNYYHGKRDEEQFKHLEDNFGIGTPTSVGFTPLIKKHIDVLVGEYLELDPDLQISCKDKKTISNIMRDKELKIKEEQFKFFKEKLQNDIISIILENKQPQNDPFFQQKIDEIKTDIENNYISEFEIAAQNILNYIKNSRDIDLKNKMRELLTDLLIGGICYYRTKPSGGKNNLELEILNPMDTFIERNRNEFYLNKSPRAVIRKWMTKEQILKEFDDDLDEAAKNKLDDEKLNRYSDNHSGIYIRTVNKEYIDTREGSIIKEAPILGILGGLEICPLPPFDNEEYYTKPLIPVYECEWIEWDKSEERLTRHKGVRIGDEIYITYGEDENIVRSVSNPKDCTLTINGIFFNDKNGHPFSLMSDTQFLQD